MIKHIVANQAKWRDEWLQSLKNKRNIKRAAAKEWKKLMAAILNKNKISS